MLLHSAENIPYRTGYMAVKVIEMKKKNCKLRHSILFIKFIFIAMCTCIMVPFESYLVNVICGHLKKSLHTLVMNLNNEYDSDEFKIATMFYHSMYLL